MICPYLLLLRVFSGLFSETILLSGLAQASRSSMSPYFRAEPERHVRNISSRPQGVAPEIPGLAVWCVVRSAHNITGLPPAAIWKLRPGCDYTVWLPVPPLSLLMNGQPSRWHSVVDGTLT